MFAIKNEKNIFWILIPIFLGFAFLSKQVPAFYIFFNIINHNNNLFIYLKKIDPLKSILLGIILFIFFINFTYFFWWY